jgi:HK97 family phage portal protein
MAILQQLNGFVNRLFARKPQADVLVGTQWEFIPYGGPAIYPDPNIITYVELYNNNWAVYTIISMIAKKGGCIPMYLYQIEDKSSQKRLKSLRSMLPVNKLRKLQTKAYGEQVIENDLSKLLTQPNPMQAHDQFMQQLIIFLESCGETFIWMNRGEGNEGDENAKPLEMWVLPSQYINLIPMPGDPFGVSGYEFLHGGITSILPAEDVIHIKFPTNLYDDYTRIHLRGLSPLKAGLKLATQTDALTDAQVSMAQNDGSKGLLAREDPQGLTPTQESIMRSVVDKRINSADMRGRVATMQGKFSYFNMSQTGKDMELNDSQTASFSRLANVFGCSPNLFMPGATYDNVKEAQKSLINNVETPLLENICGELNRALLKPFGLNGSYCIDIDVSELPELQEDQEKLVSSLNVAWWLTPNQKLEAMNEEQSSDPAMDKIYIPSSLTSIDDLNTILDDYAGMGLQNSTTGGANNNATNGGAVQPNIRATI